MKSEKPQQPVTIEEMSECERREVAFWKKTIVEWRAFRSQEGKKEELDQIFLEELQAQYDYRTPRCRCSADPHKYDG